ncbi:universal stress protein [Antarcticibacterium flavum]|uniref:Universal stress protein n=1 Tax=Antarcticibacterium flavum TaxID=2058175 RepID=A0A5B7X1R0_9FLAO|nr:MULTISPECIES: universal stress protein [Antarcticibacterium]MCM4158708.1 universal stress protein [Antarcticibacterium sp. W02-3]QCY68561.1 universal stress protein [Antarcticibacterium flavum]
MKKILLPTDFSENAYNAIRYAVQLFQKEECTFYLLNTYTPVLYDSEYILYSPSNLSLDEIYQKNSQKGLEKVEKKVKKEFSNPNHHFERISAFSLLNEEIKEQVRQKNIDLVVMGTQGATGAEQILFGTHTVHAIKRVKCPLLAIPSGFAYKSPQNILFPTDFDVNYTKHHLEVLLDLASKHQAKVLVLHISFGFELGPKQLKSKELLADYLEGTKHNFNSIEKDTVTSGIYHFQKENDVDMLVMISNKHSFFENLLFRPVINEIGFQLKTPFLVIPSGKYNT